MNLRLALLAAGAAGVVGPPAEAAQLPPANSGCGEYGPTRSDARPTASLSSRTLTLRYTGRVRMAVRGNQTAAATVSITQAGGRRVGGTQSATYTCTTPGRSVVALPLNSYGRALVRRHGQLRVRLILHLVNGSGVRSTVRLVGVIRREQPGRP